MHTTHAFGGVEIGERARNAQHAMIATRRQTHCIRGVTQERHAGGVRPRNFLQYRSADLCICTQPVEPFAGVTFRLDIAGTRDTRGNFPAAFARWRQYEVSGGYCRYFYMEVDAVEQWTGKPALIFRRAPGIHAAFAGKAWIAGAPATAGVHRPTSMKRDG